MTVAVPGDIRVVNRKKAVMCGVLWLLKKIESVPVDLSALGIGTDKLEKRPGICVVGLKHPWHCYRKCLCLEQLQFLEGFGPW